ncbi:Cupredoxin [Trichoderma sp. SZMC 28014]
MFQFPLPIPPVINPTLSYQDPQSNVTIEFFQLNITSFQAPIYPNLAKTSLVGYNGISPGPTFRVRRGIQSVVRVVNQNDLPAVLHLHGSYSRAVWDGWAEDLIQPGQYKDYYFPNSNTARTLWYHDHADMITSVNLFSGLAGFYIIEDPDLEAKLGLPQDKYDIPLALNSKQYTSTGSLISVASETKSTYGDVIQVNGQPWPFLSVEPRKYRFRILNSSLSRTFNLTVQDTTSGKALPFEIIASDSGFLSSPVTTTSLLVAMAERWEVIIDFASFANQNLTVMNGKNIFDSIDFPHTDLVMQFNVGSTVSSDANNSSPPSSLVPIDTPPTSLVNRNFKFDKKNDEWVINGVPFSDVKNRVLAAPQTSQTEIWVLENQNSGWSHPIHIHLVDFQILSRSGGRNIVEPYEKVALKDVAVLGPKETVTIAVTFAPFVGMYMFHCHNAIHEDHAMMDAFNITAIQGLGYDASDLMFADPLNATWRAKDYTDLNTQSNLSSILATFAATDAYNDVSRQITQTESAGNRLVQMPLGFLYALVFAVNMAF